ncbi:GNAT family N-acetyltransferase [Aquimarina agarilytica]|uniref:GNAT family N-acetyltransferase n=1 Tax=Aquimarina agarilytica TaxID=1087449 RepID=UPI00049268C0|nr:GNAT family N-acetyltransferase [Aquimarina agarilytica]
MIKATYSDKKHIVAILHSAFEPIHDPNSINFIVKQDAKRSERIRVLMEYLFDDCMAFGEVLLSDNKNACILLKYPHKQKLTLNYILWQVKLAFKCIGLGGVYKVLKRQATLKKHHIKDPYIHPVIMGAKNEVRGFGIGVRLIKQLIDYYSDNELPVIIETTTDENLKMYKRFGFEVFKEIKTKDFPLYFLRMN